jgi:hypothetical protein
VTARERNVYAGFLLDLRRALVAEVIAKSVSRHACLSTAWLPSD